MDLFLLDILYPSLWILLFIPKKIFKISILASKKRKTLIFGGGLFSRKYGNRAERFFVLSALKKLDLSENKLEKLADGVFENLSRLEELSLTKN